MSVERGEERLLELSRTDCGGIKLSQESQALVSHSQFDVARLPHLLFPERALDAVDFSFDSALSSSSAKSGTELGLRHAGRRSRSGGNRQHGSSVRSGETA